eukprot:CAMPEP_0203696336 /NCGR_PEP_ID=MMETSP0091-20130426/7567_1 /ASSEMBLY_ACC=CAM_ASM_001089 /TAXON_ID=426623 /ORGANISM="Chaetoceros affinis, Strain CCMP159" /LENGTH=630 /DNA_ID=CAMNT_0050568087 /DNA_START=8 /DNA_END=1900 /DNA_ORIENTATION=+
MVLFYKAVAAISSIATLATVSFLPVAKGSPYMISDDRVRKLDITPVLGRGYSIMTDSYHSTCLMVEDTTPPSYNYDYTFYEFTSQTETQRSLGGKLKKSFGFWKVKEEYSAQASSTSKTSSQTHMVVAVMRIERYYSSVREEVSPLSDDAKTLLNNQDYVGFFKACGPNYVRGIRRAQEITAIFRFQSSSTQVAKSFSAGLKVSGFFSSKDSSFASKSKFSQVRSSLSIKILGFGLGLNEEGSDTLVATSLEEYNEVMKFAFKSFTQSENSYAIGMVYGMEVVPWVDNSAFQVESKLLDDNILIPVPRSLIPKAPCKNANYVEDRNGYCCDTLQLYDTTTSTYTDDGANPSANICRVQRGLDKAVAKENMSANGEFVARLDAAMRYKLVQLSTMEKCISAANSYPSDYDDNILLPQDSVEYNEVIDASYSLMHLKIALDPFGDFGLVRHMAKELDEYIDMFYSPCLAALFGMNIDVTPDTEARFFAAYPWHTHDECMHLSCLATNMRWDRENGGCVPSLVLGSSSAAYGTGTECKKDVDSDDDTCKYTDAELGDYQIDATACWTQTSLNSFTVDYFMNHFCMPQLTADIIDTPVERNNDCDSGLRRRLVDNSTFEEKENSIKNLKKIDGY